MNSQITIDSIMSKYVAHPIVTSIVGKKHELKMYNEESVRAMIKDAYDQGIKFKSQENKRL